MAKVSATVTKLSHFVVRGEGEQRSICPLGLQMICHLCKCNVEIFHLSKVTQFSNGCGITELWNFGVKANFFRYYRVSESGMCLLKLLL